MKQLLVSLVSFLLLTACAPRAMGTIYLIDGDDIVPIDSREKSPAGILAEIGILLKDDDRIQCDNADVLPDQSITQMDCSVMSLDRAVTVTIVSPDGEHVIQTSASTVGEALVEAGFELSTSDHINPPIDTPIRENQEIIYTPGQHLSISVDGNNFQARSSAPSITEALSGVGMPLESLDYCQPACEDPLPADGNIRIVRVQEVVLLTHKLLPFVTEFQTTAELELDQQAVIQVGKDGLAVDRQRIRSEDNVEIDRQSELETVVRPVENEIIGVGTKVVIRTLQTPDGPIEYWRSRLVYATAYSPCGIYDPATLGGTRCFPYTSTGKPVQRGVAAVIRSWFYYMVGQPIYVPGYGFATIEDVGAGFADKDWIDLGFTDEDLEWWGNWTMVYWLTPVPDVILYILP